MALKDTWPFQGWARERERERAKVNWIRNKLLKNLYKTLVQLIVVMKSETFDWSVIIGTFGKAKQNQLEFLTIHCFSLCILRPENGNPTTAMSATSDAISKENVMFGVNWAPINIPLERRLQTACTAFWICLFCFLPWYAFSSDLNYYT